jgi:hypothetical protein
MSKRHYFFLLDNSVKDLRPYFRDGITETTIDHRLAPHADDMDVIDLGWRRRAIIVTTDLKFPEKCKTYERQTNGCLAGLLLLPDGIEFQKRVLDELRSGKRKMLYSAHYSKPLTWADINGDNLIIKTYRDSNPAVSELCDCPWDEDE